MKRYFLGTFFLLALTFFVSTVANAQQRCERPRSRGYVSSNNDYRYAKYNRNRDYDRRNDRNRNYNRNRNYENNYNERGYYQNQRRPSFYRRHRNLMNIGISSGAGALVGGLIGGNRKGMLTGALVGAGAGALYTYVINPKKKNH